MFLHLSTQTAQTADFTLSDIVNYFATCGMWKKCFDISGQLKQQLILHHELHTANFHSKWARPVKHLLSASVKLLNHKCNLWDI